MKTIFIQIPSYRDPECPYTIADAFKKAAHPERIYIGVCWQLAKAENHYSLPIEVSLQRQVRSVYFDARDSKGLGWARKQTQALFNGEDYTLQIDGHTRFSYCWDDDLIEQHSRCSEKAVLTVHPPYYVLPAIFQEIRPLLQSPHFFTEQGVLVNLSSEIPDGLIGGKPLATAVCAGGFIFACSEIIQAVPADPAIYFREDEAATAIRLWTNGYDLYSPSITVLYHNYQNAYGHPLASRPWLADDNPLHASSLSRFTEMLKTGLGDSRTLEDYERFSGINFSERTIADFAKSFPFVNHDYSG